MQQYHATGTIVDAFARYPTTRQIAQLRDNYHRITNLDTERLDLSRSIDAEINVQIGDCHALALLSLRSEMTGARSDYADMARHPYRAPFQQSRLHATQRKQAQETVRLNTCYHRT